MEPYKILNCDKGKGDTIEPGNRRELKLLDQVVKAIERVLVPIICNQIDINSMQFGFIVVLQLPSSYYINYGRSTYLRKKPFDYVSCKILWWAMRTLGFEE